jgi:hypothetical protein
MNVFRSNLQYNDLWLDETRPPFKKAWRFPGPA